MDARVDYTLSQTAGAGCEHPIVAGKQSWLSKLRCRNRLERRRMRIAGSGWRALRIRRHKDGIRGLVLWIDLEGALDPSLVLGGDLKSSDRAFRPP